MLVTAIDTKEQIEKDVAWLAPNRKYYTSEEAYVKWKRKKINAKYYRKHKRLNEMAEKSKSEIQRKLKESEKIAYQQCVQQMYDWMGYPATAQMPKVFFGLLGKWHKDNNYSYEVILETMYYCEDMVKWSASKEFESDSHRVRYICAIIRDHLNDGLKQFARKQKAIQDSQDNTTTPTEDDIKNFTLHQNNIVRNDLDNAMKDIMGDLF